MEESKNTSARLDELRDEIAVLNKIIEFGEKLISWEENMYLKIEHKSPLIFQLHRTIEIINSIKTLLENHQYASAMILLRSQIESFFYLEFLLQKNTEERSLSYNYWHLLQLHKSYQRNTPGTELNKQLFASMKKDNSIDSLFTPNFKDHIKEINNIERKLNNPIFNSIRTEINNLKITNIKNPNWYQYFNPKNKNIKELAYNLGHHILYEDGYRYNSQTTHSNDAHTSYFERVNVKNNKVAIHCTIESSHCAIRLYKNYVEKRQKVRFNEFSNWYYQEIEELLEKVIETQ